MWNRLPNYLRGHRHTLIEKRPECFELMHLLDNALIQRQHKRPSNPNEIRWTEFSQVNSEDNYGLSRLTSILFYAASVGFREYVIWALEKHLHLREDERTCGEILYCVVHGEGDLRGDASFLRCLLDLGLRIDCMLPPGSYYYTNSMHDTSVWQKYFMGLM